MTAWVITVCQFQRQDLKKHVLGHLTEIFFSSVFFSLKRKCLIKAARGQISGRQGKGALVSLRPRSVTSVEGRSADTYLGFTTLSTPGCTASLSIKLLLSVLTDMVFGGPKMMGIIWTRPAPLSHAVGEGPQAGLDWWKPLSSLLCGPFIWEGSHRQTGLWKCRGLSAPRRWVQPPGRLARCKDSPNPYQ